MIEFCEVPAVAWDDPWFSILLSRFRVASGELAACAPDTVLEGHRKGRQLSFQATVGLIKEMRLFGMKTVSELERMESRVNL